MPEFWKQVPKDIEANLLYRKELLSRCATDLKFRAAIMEACKQDFKFWCLAFVFLYEPRPRFRNGKELPKKIPFTTWSHQDDAIDQILAVLGKRDCGVEKSRGEGMSWLGCLFALHRWIFFPDSTVGMCSSTLDKADKPRDRGSLLGKLDWCIEQLPKWMGGEPEKDFERNITDHTLLNKRNGSLIVAFAATAGTGRGHRFEFFVLDELAEWQPGKDDEVLASLQHATESRLFISTPQGNTNAYYRVMHQPSSMVRVVLDWKDNSSKNRGLYKYENGKAVAADPVNNPLLPEYDPPTQEVVDRWSRLRANGFKLEGKWRSSWYDEECDKPGATPQKIAQELDRDYGGSMFRYFTDDFHSAARETVRQPYLTGSMLYHPETLEPDFQKGDGPICLWTSLDVEGKPPPHQYVVSADISSGLGGSHTSNSVVEVVDLVRAEQVLELASNTIEPSDFADLCISIAFWFYDAYLIWEANGGHGGAFSSQVLRRKYPNIYRRTQNWQKGKKRTKAVGWHTDPKNKGKMFGDFSRAVRRRELIIRSAALARETEQYIYLNGQIEHASSKTTDDESGKGLAHGDRVISACLALQGALDRPLAKPAKNEDTIQLRNPPRNTMAWRQMEWERSQKETDNEWDDRETHDLANATGGMRGHHRKS